MKKWNIFQQKYFVEHALQRTLRFPFSLSLTPIHSTGTNFSCNGTKDTPSCSQCIQESQYRAKIAKLTEIFAQNQFIFGLFFFTRSRRTNDISQTELTEPPERSLWPQREPQKFTTCLRALSCGEYFPAHVFQSKPATHEKSCYIKIFTICLS